MNNNTKACLPTCVLVVSFLFDVLFSRAPKEMKVVVM